MFRGRNSPAQLWRLQRHVTATFSPNLSIIRVLLDGAKEVGWQSLQSLPIASAPDAGRDTANATGREGVGRGEG